MFAQRLELLCLLFRVCWCCKGSRQQFERVNVVRHDSSVLDTADTLPTFLPLF